MANPHREPDVLCDADLELVRAALRALRFGQLVIQVHEGRIVQVERTEKIRPPLTK